MNNNGQGIPVTVENLCLMLGRLYAENQVLRQRIADLEAQLRQAQVEAKLEPNEEHNIIPATK